MYRSLTRLQRKALFKSATTLRGITVRAAAQQLGVSSYHLTLVLAGKRRGSRRLQDGIAAFVTYPREYLFPDTPRTHAVHATDPLPADVREQMLAAIPPHRRT